MIKLFIDDITNCEHFSKLLAMLIIPNPASILSLASKKMIKNIEITTNETSKKLTV